jgi:hypothetical protein
MHVLQINKSLKESISQSSSSLAQAERTELDSLIKKHNEQVQGYITQSEQLAMKQLEQQGEIAQL